MTKCLAILLSVGAMLLSSADIAQAGGGGSKSDPQVQVRNQTEGTLAVLADATRWIQDGQNPDKFVEYGGKLLNPGQTHTFKVKAGAIRVVAQMLDEDGDPWGHPANETYQVAKKSLLKLTARYQDGGVVLVQ